MSPEVVEINTVLMSSRRKTQIHHRYDIIILVKMRLDNLLSIAILNHIGLSWQQQTATMDIPAPLLYHVYCGKMHPRTGRSMLSFCTTIYHSMFSCFYLVSYFHHKRSCTIKKNSLLKYCTHPW